MSGRIDSAHAAAAWAAIQRRRKRPIAIVNGCFDGLHVGHLELLRQAQTPRNGEDLVYSVLVCIDSDRRVAFLKGSDRPIFPQAERVAMLEACRYVDRVEVFESPGELREIVEAVAPTWIVRGQEERGRKPVWCEELATRGVLWVQTPPVHTSDIVQRVLDRQI